MKLKVEIVGLMGAASLIADSIRLAAGIIADAQKCRFEGRVPAGHVRLSGLVRSVCSLTGRARNEVRDEILDKYGALVIRREGRRCFTPEDAEKIKESYK